MTRLNRAIDDRTARESYVAALLVLYKNESRLNGLTETTLRLFAETHVEKVWPKIERLEDGEKGVWCYSISAGSWAPEFSGILGGDRNLHYRNVYDEKVTLSTTGLIGLCGAAIAADIGGILLGINPVTFRRSLAAHEVVKFRIRFNRAKLSIQYFTMEGFLVETNESLFKAATVVMTGAQV